MIKEKEDDVGIIPIDVTEEKIIVVGMTSSSQQSYEVYL